MTDTREDPYAKILIRHVDGDRVHIETPWARRVGPDLYELDNVLWYAYGISAGDILEARSDGEGLPEVVRIVRKSGNRTVRVVLKPPANASTESQQVLDRLQALGCGYEGMRHSHFAINVPPQVDLMRVREFLIATGQVWEHADPSYDDLFPGDNPGRPPEPR